MIGIYRIINFLRRLSGNIEEKKSKYDIDDSETDEEFFERLRKRQKDIKRKLEENPNYFKEIEERLFGIDENDERYHILDDDYMKELRDKIDEFSSTRINK